MTPLRARRHVVGFALAVCGMGAWIWWGARDGGGLVLPQELKSQMLRNNILNYYISQAVL